VPLAARCDPTRETVNRVLRNRGGAELPGGTYEFTRAAGMVALADDLSMAAPGICDGELLALVVAAVTGAAVTVAAVRMFLSVLGRLSRS
jgi:hypothetical protein